MKTRFLLALVAAWLMTAGAQTRVQPGQLGAAPASGPRFTVYLANGNPIQVAFDSNTLVLDTSTIPATLRGIAVAVPVSREEIEVTEPTAPITGITLLQTPVDRPKVHVNGLLYATPKDYTIAGRQITLKSPVGAGDTVQIVYNR